MRVLVPRATIVPPTAFRNSRREIAEVIMMCFILLGSGKASTPNLMLNGR
jgi:hypothetical protein